MTFENDPPTTYTVAEGVENAADAAVVLAEGFGYLHGYHVGPPTIERSWLGAAPTRTENWRE